MADFQTASAAIGLARDVIELIQYLRKVKAAMDTVEDDIDGLIKELQSLNTLYGQLERKYKQQPQPETENTPTAQQGLWSELGETLKEGRATFDKFDKELREVYGNDPKNKGKIDALVKQHKLRSRLPKINAFRDQIHTYNSVLQMYLMKISLANQDSFKDFEQDASEQRRELLEGIRDIHELLRGSERSWVVRDAAPTFAEASVLALDRVSESLNLNRQASINKHFDIPQPVDSCYTGREKQAKSLAGCFFSHQPGQPQQQKRFVVYGVGGSGKTQFCCKFAQDHQQRFWGVFWIDGRSRFQLEQTLKQNVAKIGGVDLNHKAALSWLANQEEPWLLIIDNADDAAIDLMEYLPKGARGYVLITTRNPGFQSIGNLEPSHFKFDGLKKEEAYSLLIRTAGLKDAITDELKWIAEKIVDALGYLALAIAVAGSAIREGYCRIQNYLQYFENMWQERRQIKARDQSIDDFEKKREARVELTFDISYEAIAKKGSTEAEDALQLLKMISFMHCENVRFEFMKHCIENAEIEEKQQLHDKAAADKLRASRPPKSWSQWVTELLIRFSTTLYTDRGPEVLPHALRDGRRQRELTDKVDMRIRRAMQQLTQYSLATYNDKTDSWSMHPLIHKWAQEMIKMQICEQYLWCEAAATMLCNCVIIGQVNENLLRQLLPHVDEVRKGQAKIEKRIKDKRMERMKPLPIFESSFSRQRAIMLAKFSVIYAQNGRWEDAEQLQSTVQRFCVAVLGFKMPNTRRITKVLAETLWHLGRGDDSAKLLEQLVDACTEYCGPEDRETLVAKHRLGESRWLQGRISDAKRLYEESLSGLEKLCGTEDKDTLEDTLTVMDSLGNAIRLFATDEALAKARRLHQETVRILTRLYGPAGRDDLRLLTSREFLYSAATWREDRQDLLDAERGMDEIIEIRKAKLGREHGFTLLATLNQARVKVCLEKFDEADQLFNECLPIAERNHGKEHMAILFARFCQGRMRCRQKRWADARDILVDVTERQRHTLQGWGRDHPDRLGGLLELIKAHDALGELDERDEVATEALRVFKKVTTVDHPWAIKLQAQTEEWKKQRLNSAAAIEETSMEIVARDGPLSAEEGLTEPAKEVVAAIPAA